MADMEHDIFAEHPAGKVALAKMAPVSADFRLFECGIADSAGTIMYSGAEFRRALKGPNKGKLSIIVPGTTKTVYVARSEIPDIG